MYEEDFDSPNDFTFEFNEFQRLIQFHPSN